MSFTEKLKIILQYILPKHLVSVLAGHLANVKTPWFKNLFITKFAKAYKIDMTPAVEPDLTKYACFNDFFTRAIKPETRPIDESENSFCSPVDGAMSQFGNITDGKIIQAKNHDYSALELLGGDEPYIKKLDELFSMSSEQEEGASIDITGLIGQYAHGNEPSHHTT
ncbi:MAG: phosphatidylserine decarboxylase, partial [Kangiellaceae bacterium]